MGMSASQVRFLSLQHRKNTIGKELMTLSNRKLALASDMNNVSRVYNNKLSQINLKFSNDNGVTNCTIDYDLLMKPSDVNSETPLIITDREGRVVVDDEKITLTMSDGTTIGGSISYKELATLISQYSGTNSVGEVFYDNTTRVNTDGNSGLGCADPEAYVITGNYTNFNLSDAFRMELYDKMGLYEAVQDTMIELYGDTRVREFTNDYKALLKDFDNDKTKTMKVVSTDEEFTYHDVFGELSQNATTGIFELTGGCAKGNLELAKAYRDEYQAYLNTTIKYDILADNKYSFGDSSIQNPDMFDNSNYFANPDYKYNASTNTGISFRVANVLAVATSNDLSVGTTPNAAGNYEVAYKTEGLMKNLKLYYQHTDGNIYSWSLENAYTRWNYEDDNICKEPKVLWDINGGSYDSEAKIDIKPINTWSELFDMDGGIGASTGKSYDIDGDGCYTGSQYWNTSNNSGVALKPESGSSKTAIMKNLGFENLLDTLELSVKQVENIYSPAVDYAIDMTKQFYTENADEWVKKGNTFSTTNLLGVFWTFYQMFAAQHFDNPSLSETAIKSRIGKVGNSYRILNGSGADPNYKYSLDTTSVGSSVFAASITMKPANKYGAMLDDLVTSCENKVQGLENKLESSYAGFQMKMMDYFDALFKRISTNGWVYDDKINGNGKTSRSYLNAMFQNNQYFVTEAREVSITKKFKYTFKQAVNVSNIYEVHDEDAENAALAEFNREKTEISNKEKKIDRRMQKLETEQEAINTEMEAIKKVKDENVERFFKIFG